jgi:hypothetical protein
VDSDPPPEVVSVEIAPVEVDTLYRSQQVDVRVHLTDEGGSGVEWLYAQLTNETASSDEARIPGVEVEAPDSGDRSDGIWTARISVPQGTPPGTYPLYLLVGDANGSRSFVSARSPYVGHNNTVLDGPAHLTVVRNPDSA